MVLEPDLDLGGCQVDDGGEVFAFWRRQVALLAETPLQLVGLRLQEDSQVIIRRLGNVVIKDISLQNGNFDLLNTWK